MPRRATTTLAQRIVDAGSTLAQLRDDLRSYGDIEASQAVERSLHELATPAVNAVVNQAGGTTGAIRP